jgi:hypothetical protein
MATPRMTLPRSAFCARIGAACVLSLLFSLHGERLRDCLATGLTARRLCSATFAVASAATCTGSMRVVSYDYLGQNRNNLPRTIDSDATKVFYQSQVLAHFFTGREPAGAHSSHLRARAAPS